MMAIEKFVNDGLKKYSSYEIIENLELYCLNLEEMEFGIYYLFKYL